MKLRIVYMGSPAFAVPSLEKLANDFNLVGVVTQPDRPAGRGRVLVPPPVKESALQLGLPIFQPERLKTEEEIRPIWEWQPDLIVVAAFGQILRKNLLEFPTYGCLNVHASLLPRWRGAAPIRAAILHGDLETGVTIMKMDSGIDTGKILTQRAIKIQSDDTGETLSQRLSHVGADLLVETIPGYLTGAIQPTVQDDTLSTYAKMIRKDEGRLDFNQPAEELWRRVRAFNPWPGTYIEWKGSILKVHQARPAVARGVRPGEREIIDGYPAVGTANGWLILETVQLGGKKRMSGDSFLRGVKDWVGKDLDNDKV